MLMATTNNLVKIGKLDTSLCFNFLFFNLSVTTSEGTWSLNQDSCYKRDK